MLFAEAGSSQADVVSQYLFVLFNERAHIQAATTMCSLPAIMQNRKGGYRMLIIGSKNVFYRSLVAVLDGIWVVKYMEPIIRYAFFFPLFFSGCYMAGAVVILWILWPLVGR